ncbi:MAG: HAMP domain-containing sensor histidine kinase [Anaeromyxobacter sp.]
MASMGLVAASVAHEVATPVGYALTSLRFAREELARTAPALQEIEAALADAEEGAERVRRIVAEVRTFSRAGAEEGPADVARVVDSALRLAGAELRHRARVVVEVAPVPPVRASAHHLGQVLLNLLVNAAHAIPPGAPERNQVRVVARRDGDQVLVEVADTGGGIPPGVAERLFEPFFTTKAAGQGTGLGLAICKRLVDEAGGAISFESAPGQGTTFRLRLPAAPAAADAAGRARVLVVDDNPSVARALARTLASAHDVRPRPTRAARWRCCGPASPSTWSSATCACPGWTGSRCWSGPARRGPGCRPAGSSSPGTRARPRSGWSGPAGPCCASPSTPPRSARWWTGGSPGGPAEPGAPRPAGLYHGRLVPAPRPRRAAALPGLPCGRRGARRRRAAGAGHARPAARALPGHAAPRRPRRRRPHPRAALAPGQQLDRADAALPRRAGGLGAAGRAGRRAAAAGGRALVAPAAGRVGRAGRDHRGGAAVVPVGRLDRPAHRALARAHRLLELRARAVPARRGAPHAGRGGRPDAGAARPPAPGLRRRGAAHAGAALVRPGRPRAGAALGGGGPVRISSSPPASSRPWAARAASTPGWGSPAPGRRRAGSPATPGAACAR